MLKMKLILCVVVTSLTIVFMLSQNALTNERDNSNITPLFTQKSQSSKKVKKNGRPYEGLIQQIAKKYNVPVNLAHAVIRTESNYNPRAHGADGEIGLMQIMPKTARAMGYSGSFKKLYEPATNLEYGMKYLSKAYKLSHGDTCTTILKYNAGHGAKRMNPISARYCVKVKNYLASLK